MDGSLRWVRPCSGAPYIGIPGYPRVPTADSTEEHRGAWLQGSLAAGELPCLVLLECAAKQREREARPGSSVILCSPPPPSLWSSW